MAYIGIQPELVQELVDLIRVRTDQSAQMTVPLDISVLAVHCLAALVHTRYGCNWASLSPPSLSSSLCLVCVRHTHTYIYLLLSLPVACRAYVSLPLRLCLSYISLCSFLIFFLISSISCNLCLFSTPCILCCTIRPVSFLFLFRKAPPCRQR